MRLLIGAPVRARQWIVDRWLQAATVSAEQAGIEPHFVLLGPMGDPTWDAVDFDRYDVTPLYTAEPVAADVRSWVPDRLAHMVRLRNVLLTYVRAVEPELFLSLDTDMLVEAALIGNLIETQVERDWAAVGGYAYLSDYRSDSTAANMPTPSFMRRDDVLGDVVPCDVIMAIKLMTPAAFAIPYEFHHSGEDVGWSIAVRRAGLRIGVDARLLNTHVRGADTEVVMGTLP